MPKAIVSVTNDLYTDNRVNKICLFLVDQGYEVTLVGRMRKSSLSLNPRPYKTKRVKLLFEKGAKFYAVYNIRLFLFLLFHKTDLLVANDLDTLLANYLAKKLKRKCRLVYDSHELFTEVPELIDRPKTQKIWMRIERWIFPKLDTVYTVNESIANIYSKMYQKDVKVVRNISPKWEPKELMSKEQLLIPQGKPLIILQGAGINVERGAEEAVEAMKSIDAVLMIVGDGDVVPQLRETVSRSGIEDKVIFYGKKPFDIMMNYTHYADIGLTLDKPRSLNYKYSLPNKVFDYIHAGTPVVATNIIEVAKVIRKHDIGCIVDPLTPENLATAINDLLNDRERLMRYKENCINASEIENWDIESQILNKIYPKVG